MKEVTITVYEYEELSDAAKEKALLVLKPLAEQHRKEIFNNNLLEALKELELEATPSYSFSCDIRVMNSGNGAHFNTKNLLTPKVKEWITQFRFPNDKLAKKIINYLERVKLSVTHKSTKDFAGRREDLDFPEADKIAKRLKIAEVTPEFENCCKQVRFLLGSFYLDFCQEFESKYIREVIRPETIDVTEVAKGKYFFKDGTLY